MLSENGAPPIAKNGTNPHPDVPDRVMKDKSTPATITPKLKMKNSWGDK